MVQPQNYNGCMVQAEYVNKYERMLPDTIMFSSQRTNLALPT